MTMLENEAIKFIGQAVIESGKALEALQSIKSEAERIGKVGEYYANLDNCVKEIEACRVAMKALEEIQQYRAIGLTPELIEAMRGHNIALINDLEEYQAIGTPTQIYEKIGGLDVELGKYHSIGTIEEFKALKEKSVAKKPIRKPNADWTYEEVTCPTCGRLQSAYKDFYCKCGQALDWSE